MITGTESIKDFRAFFAGAVRVKAKHTLCFYRISPEVDEPSLRTGVIASKKGVHKRAVKRNRAKRRLRAALQVVAPSLYDDLEQKGLEWVLMANRSAVTCPWVELLNEVSHHSGRILKDLREQGVQI